MACRWISFLLAGAVFWAVGFCAGGCEKKAGEAKEAAVPAKPVDVLVFPDGLRVKDESVNEFVSRAMRICGEGEYEPFRLLWSVKEATLSRGDFEQGWQAVQEIRIRALEAVFLAADETGSQMSGETVYVVLADVELDPAHRAGQNEPHREVALMVVRENEEWRLAKAAGKVRAWIVERTKKREEIISGSKSLAPDLSKTASDTPISDGEP